MKSIKTIVTKEKRRKDACLESLDAEDCTDLELLEEALKEEENRLSF